MCDALERNGRISGPDAVVWRGSLVTSHLQGIKVLGTPLGHDDFVAQDLESVSTEQARLLSGIPQVHDLAWLLLLLLHCAGARANHQLRCVRPDAVREYAEHHDNNQWRCLEQILRVSSDPSVRGVGQFAALSWRTWSEKCISIEGGCILVKSM